MDDWGHRTGQNGSGSRSGMCCLGSEQRTAAEVRGKELREVGFVVYDKDSKGLVKRQ
jgi:hypothetical protein